MKTLLAIISAILFLSCSSAVAEKPFSVAIVPEKQSEGISRISCGDNSKRGFYVVLTNNSQKAQPIFDSWNSWGYQAVSFELTLSSGKKVKVAMKPQRFTRNFPSTYTIPPNGHQVFPITLNKEWGGIPDFGKAGQTKLRIKAVYELSATKESEEKGVWSGRVQSKELTVEVNHW